MRGVATEPRFVSKDRCVKETKRRSSRRAIVVAGLLSLAVPLVLYADVPHIFEDGNIIYAEDINENFENLDGRIERYEGAIHVDDETGNVGIGTESPSERLVVGDDLGNISSSAEKLVVGDAGGGAGIIVGQDADNYGSIDYNGETGNLRILSTRDGGGADGIEISNGNVGIGTSEPEGKLEVYDGDAIFYAIRLRGKSSMNCNSSLEGRMYFDSTSKHFYGCNGSDWKQLDN